MTTETATTAPDASRPLLLCKHPGCWFELPADCFPADARNIRRAGRATRCYDCESLRTRKSSETVKAGTKAAHVAALKAGGLYPQRDPDQVRAASLEARKEANRLASRRRVQLEMAETLPGRWESWLKRARSGFALYGSPEFYGMQMVEKLAPQINLPIPEDLAPFVGEWAKRQKHRRRRSR